MNYKYAFICLMAFLLVFALTKVIKEKGQKWLVRQTSIRFNQRSLDFGTIDKNKSTQAYFVFSNSGPNDLKIESIDARCGCTATNWPTTPVKPNHKDSILVQYDASEEGFFLKEIYVFSNAETSPDLLSIKGTVTPSKNLD